MWGNEAYIKHTSTLNTQRKITWRGHIFTWLGSVEHLFRDLLYKHETPASLSIEIIIEFHAQNTTEDTRIAQKEFDLANFYQKQIFPRPKDSSQWVSRTAVYFVSTSCWHIHGIKQRAVSPSIEDIHEYPDYQPYRNTSPRSSPVVSKMKGAHL